MKKRKNILKEAIVLLIAAAMLLSTVAVTANTEDDLRNSQTSLADSFAKVGYTYVENDPDAYPQNRGPVIFSQPYGDYCTGPFSDEAQGYRVYDNFWGLSEDICDVHWWGLMAYGDDDPTGSQFEVGYFPDDGGMPDLGNPTATFTATVGVEISFADTGIDWYSYSLFYFEMDHSCVSMTDGWLSVYRLNDGTGERFAWMDDGPGTGDGQAYQENFNPPWLTYDVAFELTGADCQPSVDVEKYVMCPCTEEWFDADTEDEALDLPICTDVTFKIVIHNNGECCGDLFDINVYDKMHDSLKFISADPEPQEVGHDPPYWYIFWNFPGPLPQCNTIEIIITAHVEGPECSIDFNYVEVVAHTQCPQDEVYDSDFAYVHAYENKPPTAPIITGQRKGNPGTAYRWTFHSSDPNGDKVQYIIDWGDGTSDTTPCTPSCTPYDVIHTYANEGDYEIKAKAKDCCWGLEGPESTFKVSMPRNRARNAPVLQFLQNYLQMFPMLRLLVQRLGL